MKTKTALRILIVIIFIGFITLLGKFSPKTYDFLSYVSFGIILGVLYLKLIRWLKIE